MALVCNSLGKRSFCSPKMNSQLNHTHKFRLFVSCSRKVTASGERAFRESKVRCLGGENSLTSDHCHQLVIYYGINVLLNLKIQGHMFIQGSSTLPDCPFIKINWVMMTFLSFVHINEDHVVVFIKPWWSGSGLVDEPSWSVDRKVIGNYFECKK